MVKILNCYLYAKKKVMTLCLKVQFFLAIPVYELITAQITRYMVDVSSSFIIVPTEFYYYFC